MKKIRVLLVDDHGIFRAGVRMLLQAQADVEMVGEASHGQEAIGLVQKLKPDVVLMDISMPDMDGFAATRQIKLLEPEVPVLALTMYESEEHFFRMLSAGASGYVPKKAAATDLLTAIRVVSQGGAFLFPSVAKALVDDFLRRVETGEERSSYDGLTDREQEVLKLIAEGVSNKEIAERLILSTSTVERHRSNIMEKLHLHSRTELIKYAIRKRLINVEA